MSSLIKHPSSATSYQFSERLGRATGLRVMGLLGLALSATVAFTGIGANSRE